MTTENTQGYTKKDSDDLALKLHKKLISALKEVYVSKNPKLAWEAINLAIPTTIAEFVLSVFKSEYKKEMEYHIDTLCRHSKDVLNLMLEYAK